MDRTKCLNSLFDLKCQAELIPRIRGRADLVRKIEKSIEWLEMFKVNSESNIPRLFYKECRQAVEDMNAIVEEIAARKEAAEKAELEARKNKALA